MIEDIAIGIIIPVTAFLYWMELTEKMDSPNGQIILFCTTLTIIVVLIALYIHDVNELTRILKILERKGEMA